MHEPFDITTVIFAVLAVFVVWKLRSVLGTRTGNERPPFDPLAERKAREGKTNPPGQTATVIRLPGAGDPATADGSSPAGGTRDGWSQLVGGNATALRGLERIKAEDAEFSPTAFVEGARAAYEMILVAFAKGDRATLTPLLARDVFDSFSTSITEREAAGHSLETTFVSLDKSLIEEAQMRGRTAQITMRFQPKLISVTRDKAGEIVEGSSDQIATVTDLWTFARDVGSSDPNWKLVATETVT